MLNDTVKYLASRLSALPYIKTVSGIVDIVEQPSLSGGDPMLYPAVYTGSDSLRFVTSYDFRTGLAFFLRGRATKTIEAGKRAGATYIQERQRPELVIIAARPDKESTDNMLATLTKTLTVRNTTEARTATGSTVIRGIPASFATEPDDVLRDVFANVDIPHRHDLVFVRAELDITSYYYTDCITTVCP